MGRKRVGTKRGGEGAATALRRELVKTWLIEGMSEPEIVRQLVAGVTYKGHTIQAAARHVALDLQRLSAEWRGLHDDPEVTEREVGAIRERVRKLAVRAGQEAFPEDGPPNPQLARVALNAESLLLRLAAIRSTRWQPPRPTFLPKPPGAAPAAPALTGPVSGLPDVQEEARVLEAVARIRSMSNAELLAHVRAQRARVEAEGRRIGEVIDAPPQEG